MGIKEKYSSLTSFSDHPLVNIVIMLLIVIGGIGFLVWDDIRENKHHIRKYRMQTKLVLITSAFLILMPAIYFFLEFAGMDMKVMADREVPKMLRPTMNQGMRPPPLK